MKVSIGNELDFLDVVGFIARSILKCVKMTEAEDGVRWFFERAWYDSSNRMCVAIFRSYTSSGHRDQVLEATAVATEKGRSRITITRELGPNLERRTAEYDDVVPDRPKGTKRG